MYRKTYIEINLDNISNNVKNIIKKYSEEIENKIGYDRNYLIKCLKNEEVNYATATYYLMLKDKYETNDLK